MPPRTPKYMMPPFDEGDIETLISQRNPRNMVELKTQIQDEAPHLMPFLKRANPDQLQVLMDFYRRENGMPTDRMQMPAATRVRDAKQ